MTRALTRSLASHALHVSVFDYSSRAATAAQHAAALARFIDQHQAQHVYLMAHSYGGILALHLFARDQAALLDHAALLNQAALEKVRAIVLMASPVMGSSVARRLLQHKFSWWARKLAGHSLSDGLCSAAPQWGGTVPLGVMAGVRKAGISAVLLPDTAPSDGVVAVSETQVEGSSAELQMRVSHAGFLWSHTAVAQAAYFFQHGSFAPNDELPDP